MNELLTVKEAAAILGVHPSRVRYLINDESDDRLPAQKLGRDWLLRREDVEAFRRLPVGNPNFGKRAEESS